MFHKNLFKFYFAFFALLYFIIFSSSAPSSAQDVSADNNCVWYKTDKSVMWLGSADVVGMNCHIEIKPIKKGELLSFEILIPIEGFNSGSNGRDERVDEILKSEKQPNLVFSTEYMNRNYWQQLISKPEFKLNGILNISGLSTKVTFHVTTDIKTCKGKFITNYSWFKIEPPVAGPGGMVARTRDYLELHFSVKKESIENLLH